MILRSLVVALLATTAATASAAVSTVDYDRLTVLPALTNPPASRDWRSNGAVTAVKNEGACDASWAFGVTGLVEGYHAINSGTLFNLSEQELVDCNGAGSGCGGGSTITGMRTVIARGGLATAASYPFTGLPGACKVAMPVATIPGAGRVPVGDETSLQGYVNQGPVMVLVGESAEFNAYSGGVFTGPCSTNPTRAMLVVGFGTGGDGDYWIVKNSRGSAWGSSGYVLLQRGANRCGIANYAVAVSNDALPAPAPATPAAIAVPTSSEWAVMLLALGLAASGWAAMRGGKRKAP